MLLIITGREYIKEEYNMHWVFIFIAGLFEIVWVLGLRFSNGFTELVPSVVTIATLAVSFYLFSKSLKFLPIGTAYAIFTGFGAAGTSKLFFIGLMLAGIIGLKLTTPAEVQGEEG
jgi:quaternary ammonium compound-resistance protein SugE